ncbi:hypothetical protein MTR67_011570 [Solanum verrucosum]|uniref:Bifunctional inhibitor/plant lipid transfer protein/seed storage helical domain-containing protein n=1 Tax=Solanum verrucosum TaxID=315347 RepID=A0AAF0Q9M6_SOLVR|nr:hypothetical protein MTR67_011570 [Solanum verrucosum]
MTKATSFVAIFLVGAMALFLGELLVTAQEPCNVMALGSCAPSTWTCCAKLKEQEPCLCEYSKNPIVKPYVNSTRVQMVFKTCKVSIPKC